MKCNICFDNIYIFYYKSKCKCNLYYHYECIEEWYKYNNCCIYCKKKDNTNIQYIKTKLYENCVFIILIISYIISYFYIILYK